MVATVLYPLGLVLWSLGFLAVCDWFNIIDAYRADSVTLPVKLLLVLLFLAIAVPAWIYRHALVYHWTRVFLRVVLNIFFKSIEVIGENENVPAKGPFILVGNHSNQFVDGLMFLTIPKRNVYLLMAAKSLKKAGVGWFGAAMRAIPVRRPQDEAFPGSGRLDLSSVRAAPTALTGVNTRFTTEVEPKAIIEVEKRTAKVLSVESDTALTLAPPGFTDKLAGDGRYKIWPHIAQAEMYEGSYRAFLRGACVGLFPEGGSHDRGELIPIKAGVALMAFELMSRIPTLEVPIVACGLNYYQGHRFHGRVVLLFGAPLIVTRAMYEEYLVDRTGAVNRLIARVQEALYHVVLEFPDHSTFVFIQTMRNLFRPDHKRLTDHENFKLMYQLKILHNATKNNEQTKELWEHIQRYHELRKKHGFQSSKDWERSLFGIKAVLYLIYLLAVSALAIIPGLLLNAPVGLLIRILSLREKKKALKNSAIKRTGQDVVASHKILMGFFLLPVWYLFVSILLISTTGAYLTMSQRFLAVLSLPLFSYLGVVLTEQGVVVSRKLMPLFLRLLPQYRKDQEMLRGMRANLQEDIRRFVDTYGGDSFYKAISPFLTREDFEKKAKVRKSRIEFDDDDLFGNTLRS